MPLPPEFTPTLSSNRSGMAPALEAILMPLSEIASSLSETSNGATGDDAPTEESIKQAREALESVVSDYADQVFPQVPSAFRDILFDQRVDGVGFRANLNRRWGQGLRWLDRIGEMCLEVGAELSAIYVDPGVPDWKVAATSRLHARSCQVFREITTLLRNGYADGANARWRTLHELAVTITFLSQQKPATSEQFIEHERIESCKAAEEYTRWYQRLGFDPIDPVELQTLQAERDRLIHKYGGVFNTAYGWAASALNRKDRFSIEAIENAIDLSHLRPFYRMASHAVHAAPKSAFHSLSNPYRPNSLLLVGPSNAGLADPGQNAGLSLIQATTPILLTEPKVDRLVISTLLMRMLNAAMEAFANANHELNVDEMMATFETDIQKSTDPGLES